MFSKPQHPKPDLSDHEPGRKKAKMSYYAGKKPQSLNDSDFSVLSGSRPLSHASTLDTNLMDIEDVATPHRNFKSIEEVKEEVENQLFYRAELPGGTEHDDIRFKQKEIAAISSANTPIMMHCRGSAAPLSLRSVQVANTKVNEVNASVLSWLWLALWPYPLQQVSQHITKKNSVYIFKQPLIWSHGFELVLRPSVQVYEKLKEGLCGKLIKAFKEEFWTYDSSNFPRRSDNLLQNPYALDDRLKDYKCDNPFSSKDPVMMIHSVKDDPVNGTMSIYFAWNTATPELKAHDPSIKTRKSCELAELNYEVPASNEAKEDDIPWLPASTHGNAEATIAHFIYDFFINATAADDNEHYACTEDDIINLMFDLNYRQSSLPIFYPAQLVLNEVKADPSNIQWDFGKNYPADAVVDAVQNIDGLPQQHFDVVKMLLPLLINYSRFWNSKKQIALNLFNNDHAANVDRWNSVVKELQHDSINVPDDLLTPVEEGGGDVVEGVLKAVCKALVDGCMNQEEAEDFMMSLSKRPDGVNVASALPHIMDKIAKVCEVIHSKAKRDISAKKVMTRRQRLGEFLFNYTLYNETCADDGRDVTAKILALKSRPDFDRICAVMTYYLQYSMGMDFVEKMFDYVMVFDETTEGTKVKSTAILGESDIGKSEALSTLLHPYVKRFISFDGTGKVDVDHGEDYGNSSRKAVKIYPDFLIFEEFDVNKGFSNKTMPRASFNNLTDWNRRPARFRALYAPIEVMTKAPIFLITHDPPQAFQDTSMYDASFFSRFDVWVNLSGKLKFTDKVGLQNCQLKPTEIPKPVFPLILKGSSTNSTKHSRKRFDTEMNDPELLKYGLPVGIVAEDDIQKAFKSKKKAHVQLLKKNPVTAEFLDLGDFDKDEAAWIASYCMVKLWDRMWKNPEIISLQKREEAMPLNSGRAFAINNILNASSGKKKYKHEPLNIRFFPSEQLMYPHLLEDPQALAAKIIEEKRKLIPQNA